MIYGYILSLTLSIIFPLVVVIVILRRIKVNIWLLTAGIVTYIASQVLYFPLQYLYLSVLDKLPAVSSSSVPAQLLIALVAAFLIALSEDVIRWLVFRYFRKNTDTWQSSVAVGLGFGAIASIAMGIVTFMEFNYVLQVTTPNILDSLTLSPAELETLKAQQAIFAAVPWYEPATRGLVFLITFMIQVMFTIMIWKGVKERSWKWLLSAFGVHVGFEFMILALQKYSPGPWMNVLAVIAFGSILLAALYQLLFKQWIRDHQAALAAAKRK